MSINKESSTSCGSSLRGGAAVCFHPVPGVRDIEPATDLATEIIRCLEAMHFVPQPSDVIVVAQKIVSKAEGRHVDLASVRPSAQALQWAEITSKDARLIEVILAETDEVVRAAPNVFIVRHRRGYVMANAGVDKSNVGSADGREIALLLPLDPDASADRLHRRISDRFRSPVGVIISDSFGRPWRNGVVNVALGLAGLPAVVDWRGQKDRYDRTLEITEVAHADAVAAGAALVMGEAAEGNPVVLVRGLQPRGRYGTGQQLLRSKGKDLFR